MEVAGQKKRGNYDDQPEVDEQCTKLFPSVSFGGFGYMFLWFCPYMSIHWVPLNRRWGGAERPLFISQIHGRNA